MFIFHHGAGHSGLSFALTASHIKEMTDGQCSIVALDARGHGMFQQQCHHVDIDNMFR